MERRWRLVLTSAAGALLVAGVVWAAQSATPAGKAPGAKAPGGKELFITYKCTSCHSVDSEKIEKRKAAGTEAAEGEDAKTAAATPATPKKNSDLSGVGVKKDAAWFSKYLMKEEKLDEKLHKTKFRGTPQELREMSAWLESLKKPAAKLPDAKK
jgi:cytochrome c2